MLDSAVLNDTLGAGGLFVYRIPVEQVERIEVIRGPGSVIYGEYAYAGVINVVTRKKGNRVYAVYDSDGGYGGGGRLSNEMPAQDLEMGVNLSVWRSDGAETTAGEDRLYSMGLGDFSYAPGPANESQEDRFATAFIRYKDFSLTGQYVSKGSGDHFGVINVLPYSENRVNQYRTHMLAEAAQHVEITPSLKTDIRAGYRHYEFEMEEIVALPPISIPMPDGSFYQLSPPDGSISGPYYEEREIYGSADFLWTGTEKHTLVLGLKYSDIQMEDVWVDANTVYGSWGEMIRAQGESNWLTEDQIRAVFSLYVQDMFALTDRLTLTAGLRYDHYDDMGDDITPRLSAVWNPVEHHILKAQYSEAYRPPTFTELYSRGSSILEGSPDLKSEHIRSMELGYIFRKQETAARVTLFRSELKDNIEYPLYADAFSGMNIRYRNAEDKITAMGVELEWEQSLLHNLELGFNLSYADTEHGETGEPLDGSADWLGNALLSYTPLPGYTLGLRYRYVGERHRATEDDRDKLDDCHTADRTLGISDLFVKGLHLRAGVSNLFEAHIAYPAPVAKDPDGNMVYTYEKDYPQAGREDRIVLSCEF